MKLVFMRNLKMILNLKTIVILSSYQLKEFHPILPDNYLLSLKRLNKLKEPLDRNRELLKHCNNIFQEKFQAGIIEEVHDEGECCNVTYLPHREVVKDQSTTTKVRIVFDASARLKGQPCLNDVL